MANIKPPPKKENTPVKKATKNKGTPPKLSGATVQTPPDSIKPLQLKIPESAKNEFKAYAAMQGKSMNTLFLEMFLEHKAKHA